MDQVSNTGSLAGTMNGMDVRSPASGQVDVDDPAVLMMQRLAGELGAPQAQPPTADPFHQFLSLLAANAGAQLLQQPGAAIPANRAVAEEMGKPEKFRLEEQERQDKARSMRLQAMIRAADNAAKNAENAGEWEKALAKHKQAKELQEEAEAHELKLERLRQAGRMAEIGAKGEEDRKTTNIEIAGRQKLLEDKLNGIATQYGLTKNQTAELNNFGDSLDRVLGGGYVGSVTAGGGVFTAEDAAAVAQKQNELLRQKAAEIKQRDSLPPGVHVFGQTPSNPYMDAYRKYSGKK